MKPIFVIYIEFVSDVLISKLGLDDKGIVLWVHNV